MNSQLQNKLLHYEVPPPGVSWDRIATSLDESIPPGLSQKLYHYQNEPPAGTWQQVAARLDVPMAEKARVLPFYVRYRRPLKYSAAVAAFIFIAVLTSLLFSKKTVSETAAETIVSAGVSVDTTAVIIPENKSAETPTRPGKTMMAKAKGPKVKTESTPDAFSIENNFLPTQVERNAIVTSSLSPDKYMIYSDEEGNAIRLPKKIFSAFACPQDDYACKQKLRQLREKFAASATTADFNGLLQILKSLQENQ